MAQVFSAGKWWIGSTINGPALKSGLCGCFRMVWAAERLLAWNSHPMDYGCGDMDAGGAGCFGLAVCPVHRALVFEPRHPSRLVRQVRLEPGMLRLGEPQWWVG
ncbi:MAG TPA: hypothetical protein PLH75_12030, partial [Amaricoccus sp.]|nr:hypothetical protein [Amaricoccus sp.]